jgi:DNA-binding winged helix-turn-helix (wHTH) protein
MEPKLETCNLTEEEIQLTDSATFTVQEYLVDPSSLIVSKGGQSSKLEPQVMTVLVYLAGKPGKVVSRVELEDNLWAGKIVTDDALTKTISKLRKIFDDDARNPQFIKTVPKKGYKLITDAQPIDKTEFNPDYIVRGSIQRVTDNLRINIQLIKPNNEQAIWAQRHDSKLIDIFKVQGTLAIRLVSALEVALLPEEKLLVEKSPTNNIVAYDLFLKGVEAYGHRTPSSNDQAKDYFQNAIEIDPQFSRAIASLALAHVRDAIDGVSTNAEKSFQLTEELSMQAITINKNSPQIHFIIGQIALFNSQHEKALDSIQQAIHLSPNYADAYALKSWILAYTGQFEQALDT